jgi:spermidine synthase
MLTKVSDMWFSEFHDYDVKFSTEINEVLVQQQTPFQHLHILKSDTFGTFMTLDGYIQVTEMDEFVYHDMICHPAMAVNPNIKRVLIIGGGDGGSAREVARYKHIEKLDMVEIDGAVVEACIKHLPVMSTVLTNEPRLNLIIGDGLAFVQNAPDNSYDLILVDSTDPFGPGEDLFTVEFYNNCSRVLSEDGILINQHEGAFYEGDVLQMKKAHSKIKQVFPIAKVYGFNIPTYASGYWYFGFASKKYDPLTDLKADQWAEFGLDTKYYNCDLHKGAFALPNYVKKILESV